MNFLRLHWFDPGMLLAVLTGGWLFYFLAVVLNEQAIWLGIAW